MSSADTRRPGHLTWARFHKSAVHMQKSLLVTPASEDRSSGAQRNAHKGEDQNHGTQKHTASELVDLRDLNRQQRQQIVDNALATNEQSNEGLLEKYAERAERYPTGPSALVPSESNNQVDDTQWLLGSPA